MSARRVALAALAAGFATTFVAQAQSPADGGVTDAVTFSPRASLRTEWWSGSRSLDDRHDLFAASLWTDGKLRSDAGTLVWNGWLRAQHPHLDGDPHLEGRGARVRELYWRQAFGAVDVRAGRLMPAWGRADGLNPTDNLSARDYTLLAPEDADLRFGRDGVQMDWSLPRDAGVLSATWFAQGDRHRIPLPQQPGVTYRIDALPRRDAWALKWDLTAGGVDGSVSYYDGTDLMPDLSLAALSLTGVEIALRNARTRVWGADLSVQRGAAVWRAEAAYAQPRTNDMENDVDDFTHKRPMLTVVGGPEWSGGGWTVGAQAVWQWVRGFRSPDTLADPIARDVAWRQAATNNQVAAQQRGLTLRLARRAWNDTLLLETTLLALWPTQPTQNPSGLWRSKLDYALDDHWNVQLGHERPLGPAHSQMGQLKQNRLAYVQLRRSF